MSSLRQSGWQPILAGPLREQAQQAVVDICADLGTANPADAREGPELLSQFALLHAYLGIAWNSTEHAEKATAFQEQSIERLADTPIAPALYGGFTGIAWIVEHLQHPPLGDPASADDGDPNEEIDSALLSYLETPVWKQTYDLIGGLVGFGVYALERLPRKSAEALLSRILDHLAAMATRENGEASWWTALELIPPISRDHLMTGHYNLGVAHGVPGVVGFLAQLNTAGLLQNKVRPLISGAVAWLLKQRLPKGSDSVFATTTGHPGASPPSRAAWCYGDPGIALVLLAAARSFGEREWEEQALAIGREVAQREPKKCGVNDAGLCHGASGLAHLFNRFFQATGEDVFLKAARFWFGQALQMRKPGAGIAGFAPWYPKDTERDVWSMTRGFLMGGSGIALALLAAITDLEPRWDRLLLASVSPARHVTT
jgi:lantibiotic modifying enzyme